jgi:hypothetical protein
VVRVVKKELKTATLPPDAPDGRNQPGLVPFMNDDDIGTGKRFFENEVGTEGCR